MALLNIKNLSVTYQMPGRLIHAVDQVSLTLEDGQSLGLVGESGSGKSTLGMAVLRLLSENAKVEGSVLFRGEEMLTMPYSRLSELRWRKIAAVFQ